MTYRFAMWALSLALVVLVVLAVYLTLNDDNPGTLYFDGPVTVEPSTADAYAVSACEQFEALLQSLETGSEPLTSDIRLKREMEVIREADRSSVEGLRQVAERYRHALGIPALYWDARSEFGRVCGELTR